MTIQLEHKPYSRAFYRYNISCSKKYQFNVVSNGKLDILKKHLAKL